MRACAEVNIVPLFEEAEFLILGQVVYKLYLVGLALILHKLYSLGSGKCEALHLKIFLNDFLHFGFESGYILVGKSSVAVEIVIEAVFNRRTYGKLGFGEQPLYCLRQYVRRSVTQCAPAYFLIKGMFLDAAIVHDDFHSYLSLHKLIK